VQRGHPLDGGLPVAHLGDDRVALFLEHLLEVHTDQGFVLGDHDTQVLAHLHESTVTGYIVIGLLPLR